MVSHWVNQMDKFEWNQDATPLAHPAWPIGGMLLYLATVFTLKRAIRDPVTIPRLVASVHNLVLCMGSLAMFLGTLEALWQVCAARGSLDFVFCTPIGTRPAGRLWFWSYVYYLSKYYEFLDTILLLLKAKPASFLHVFHHAFVVVMSWLWVDQVQTLQFGGLLTNTAVHVVMYFYYFLTTLKISPWWKKYITSFQILQFVSSFITLPVFLLYQLHLRKDAGGCAGLEALAFNAAFNLALLLLFVQFYRASYSRRQTQKKRVE